MINQTIHIDGLENHLLCLMQCCLNGVHISEVTKFLAESHSVTTHAIDLRDPLYAAHLLMILLQLSGVTSYFDVYSMSIAEYVNEDIPKIISLLKNLHRIHQQMNIQRDLNVLSLRPDQCPCHSSKGTIICQSSYLVLTGL